MAADAYAADRHLSQRHVLLLHPVFPAFEAAMDKRFNLLKPWEAQQLRREFLEARAVVVSSTFPDPIDAELIASLPQLGLVVTTSAGVDHIDMAECKRRGIAVVNAGATFTEDAADYAVGLLTDVLHRVSAADRYVRGGLWPLMGSYPLCSRLGGKRVGIVGLGNIGSEVAKRLEAFGCIISYISRKKKPSSYKFYANVVELAADNDILVLCCSLNSKTHHIIEKNVMDALGKEGIIINIGRGALVDEEELVRQLMEGGIGGAGLDVFEHEPVVHTQLFDADNVVLSPHRAVFSSEAIESIFELAVENMEAFFNNKPLLSQVAEI